MRNIPGAFPVSEWSHRGCMVADIHRYDDLNHDELVSDGVELLLWEAALKPHNNRALLFEAINRG